LERKSAEGAEITVDYTALLEAERVFVFYSECGCGTCEYVRANPNLFEIEKGFHSHYLVRLSKEGRDLLCWEKALRALE